MAAPLHEPISPELVLVDPELAERARASLPEEPWRSFIPPPRIRPAATLVAAAPVETPRARRRVPVAGLVGAAATVGLIAALSFDLVPSPGARPTLEPPAAATRGITPSPAVPARPRAAAGWPRAAAAPATAKSEPAPQAVSKPSSPAPRVVQPAPAPLPVPLAPNPAQPPPAPARPAQPPPAAPTPTPPPRKQRAKPKPPARPEPFEPARLFVWVPARGASYYQLLLWRDGKRVYEGYSRLPRIRIPESVRFAAGKYVWVVRAGQGRRAAGDLGKPIVTSRFTVR